MCLDDILLVLLIVGLNFIIDCTLIIFELRLGDVLCLVDVVVIFGGKGFNVVRVVLVFGVFVVLVGFIFGYIGCVAVAMIVEEGVTLQGVLIVGELCLMVVILEFGGCVMVLRRWLLVLRCVRLVSLTVGA